jgi:serine/threonine-protein kinase RsbW
MVQRFSFKADVPGGPGAAREARGLIRRELAGRIPAPALGDLALLVTELIANGVRHGGAGARSVLRLRFEGGPDVLRVEVADPGRRPHAVRARPVDGRRGGGMGLQIVDRIATRWGVRDGSHTSVWFELDCR